MLIKKILVIGTVLATLGTGTGVFAATHGSTTTQQPSQTVKHKEKQAYIHRKHHRLKGGLFREAAKTLKMNEKTLVSKLKSGKSLADVAKTQGVSVTTLKANLQSALKSKLDKAVKSGKVTAAQEQKILTASSKKLDQLINHKGLPKAHRRKGHFWLKRGLFREAAKTLKMNEKTLVSKLKSGKSLADVAKAQGVSTATLKSDLQSALKSKLDKAVKSGKMTAVKEQKILTASSKRLDQLINHKGLPKAHRRKGHFWLKRGLLKETAKALKMNEKTLVSELKSGKSLADVAKAQGVSTATLKSDLQSALKSKLDKAVKSGKLTTAKEQKIFTAFNKRIDRFLNLKRSGHSKTQTTTNQAV